MATKFIYVFLGMVGLTVGHAQMDTIMFENVNVIPMHEKTILYNHRVVVYNGKILRVEPTSSASKYTNATIVDGTGKYLIPGLSEMHYHWRNKEGGIERDFKLLLANGVTTVRNMAEYDWQDHVAIRDSILRGEKLGPNYFTTGPYLNRDNLNSEQDAVSVVGAHKENGYDFLKLADNLSKEVYLKVLEEAQKYKLSVIGHAQREMPLEYSLRMKSIEHIEEFVYLFDDDQRTDDTFLENAVGQIKNSGAILVPTLVVFDMIVKSINDETFHELSKTPSTQYMLSGDFDYWSSDKNPYRENLKGKVINGKDAELLLDEYFKWMKAFTKRLVEANVPMMTGCDTFGFVVPGFSLHEEFKFMNACGLTPFEVLMASTVTPARYLNTIATEGTITEGKNANMVLLNKNPLENIVNTKTIEGVMLKGEWFNRKRLDGLLDEVKLPNH